MKTHVTALLYTYKFLILNRYTQCGEVTLKIKRKEEEEKKNFQTCQASSLRDESISNQIKKVETKYSCYIGV